MSEPHFLYEKRGHTAICTFNRPERRNSLSMEMLVRMADAWAEADGDPEVRAIVLTGAGGTFCAGSDLGSMSTGKWEADDVWMNRMKEDPDIHWRALLRHYVTKKPLIAAVFALGENRPSGCARPTAACSQASRFSTSSMR